MGDQSLDLRLPKKISVKQLITELDTIFKNSGQRQKYQLKVTNKGILLGENDILSHYPITNGDRIKIEEMN